MLYLDSASTSLLSEPVVRAIKDVLNTTFANPSSAHELGLKARELREIAREQIAHFVDCDPKQIIFVSSGSEANTQILLSAQTLRMKRLLTTSIEHASIESYLEACKSKMKITRLQVNRKGLLLNFEEELKTVDDQTFASIQWVNNETGVCLPIEELCQKVQQRGGLFHADLSQGIGKLPFSFKDSGLDFATITGHKLHAPSGIAVLIAKDTKQLARLIYGGDQEHGRRGGTENLLGIVALGAAVQTWDQQWSKKIGLLRDKFESVLTEALNGEVTFIGSTVKRAPHISSVCFRTVDDGLALFAQLVMRGFCLSQGSACTTGRPEPSRVLSVMGFSEEEAYQTIRFSFSYNTSFEEIRLEELVQVVRSLSHITP